MLNIKKIEISSSPKGTFLRDVYMNLIYMNLKKNKGVYNLVVNCLVHMRAVPFRRVHVSVLLLRWGKLCERDLSCTVYLSKEKI